MGDTSLGQMAFIAEVTAGVTPATPTFLILDHVSETLEMTANQIRSNVVNSARVVKKSRRAGQEVGGSVNIELYKSTEIDALLAALLGNAFTGSPLRSKAGGSTLTSFTFERKLSATDYRRYTGCRINSLGLSIVPEQFVTADIGVIGYSQTNASTAIVGSNYTAAGTGEKLTPLDIASVTLSNGITGSYDFASINLNVSNNMQAKKRITASPVRGVVAGLATIDGTMEIYCEDKTFADAFNNETSFDMDIPLINGAQGYTLECRSLKITSYNDANPGNGDSFMARVGFEATLSAAYASSFGIQKSS